MRLHNLLLSSLLLLAPAAGLAKSGTVTSPSGKITVTLEDGANGLPLISVNAHGKQILDPSPIGLDIQGRKTPLAIKSVKNAPLNKETIPAPFHHTPQFTTEYNELRAELGDGLALAVRAYDEGAAYRFISSKKTPLIIENETAEFVMAQNPELYLSWSTNDKKPMAMAFQNFYQVVPAKSAPAKYAFLPTAADYGDGVKAVITESDLEAYPGMFLVPDSINGSLKAEFAKYPVKTDFYPWRQQEYVTETADYIAKTNGARSFPWRVIAISDNDTQLPTNNLVYALASPSRVANTFWIKPGKVAWDWWNDWGLRGVDFKAGINTETYKYYIDFASKNGIEYIVLDEGWYDPKSGDMLTVIPEIDLPGLIAYGKEKGVDIVLWTVFNVLDNQLEEACQKYAEMGVKGFKVDFLDRDDQTGVEMAYRIADATARHHLMLDYHGFYKPTGLNRTYPNIINFEAVFGMEEMKWSDPSVDMPLYNVTFPYIRQLAGPVDFTPGAMRNASKKDWKAIYYNPMSQGTRGHQTAMYVVFDSPFTMLADSPSLYEKNQDWVDFVTGIPTVFESSEIVDGKMGEYIVTRRQNNGSYYLGGLTSWTPRNYTIDFSFLPAGKQYDVTMLADGINAEKQGDDYKISTLTVDNGSKVKVHMAPGGGFALRVDPVK